MINANLPITPGVISSNPLKSSPVPDPIANPSVEPVIPAPLPEVSPLQALRELSNPDSQREKLSASLSTIAPEELQENAHALEPLLVDILPMSDRVDQVRTEISTALSQVTSGRNQIMALDHMLEDLRHSSAPDVAVKRAVIDQLKAELLEKYVSEDFSLTDHQKMERFIKDFSAGTTNLLGMTHNKDMVRVNEALKQLHKLVKADPHHSNPDTTLKKFAALKTLQDNCRHFLLNDDNQRETGKTRSSKYAQVEALLQKINTQDQTPLEKAFVLKTNAEEVANLSQNALEILGLPHARAFSPRTESKVLSSQLSKLQLKLSPATFDRMTADYTNTIAHLIDAVGKDDAGAVKLALHRLQLQSLQATFLAEPTPEGGDQLTAALDSMGQEVCQQFFALHPEANTPELQQEALKQHLIDSYRAGDSLLSLAVTAHAKKLGGDSVIAGAVTAAGQTLNRIAQAEMAQIGASKDERTAQRVPSEVTIDWLAAVQKAAKDTPDQALNLLVAEAKQHYMRHDMTVEKTRIFLTTAARQALDAGHPELQTLAENLLSQLPNDDASVSLYRLQDNIYGRVFDSAVINQMVIDPLPSVLTAMDQTKIAVRDYLLDEHKASKSNLDSALKRFQQVMQEDQRFWLTKVPELETLKTANTPEARREALENYLNKTSVSGYDAVSVPYFMTKFFIVGRNFGIKPAWLTKGDANYRAVHQTVVGRTDLPGTLESELGGVRTFDLKDKRGNFISDDMGRTMKANIHVDKKKTKASGITLHYQPTATPVDDSLTPATRPTTYNMPKMARGNDITEDDLPTEVVKTALGHGAPFASGVSGSTNIMLHLFESIKAHDPGLDARDFLIGTMNFLVHDGGHSMHEVMWTANQLDQKLNLGLNLGDPDKPLEFVADYHKLVDLYNKPADAATKIRIETIMSNAFETTTAYFDQHSYYARAAHHVV